VRYEWDAAKDVRNRRKHGMALGNGIEALADPERVDWIDERLGYGEERWCTLGRVGQLILLVAHVEPAPGVCRIISVRRATRHEQEIYFRGELEEW
jgi:hypothetical protein